MAVSIVRVGAASAASTNTISVDVDTSDGDYVFATLLWRNDAQTISTFTREGVSINANTVGTDDTDANERVSCGMRRSAGAGGTTDTFQATLSGSSTAIRIVVFVLSGVDSGSPVASADTNANIGTANAFIITDATTVAAGNLALCSLVVRDNVSATLVEDGGANTTDRDAINNVNGSNEITTYCVSFTANDTIRFDWTEPGAGNWAKVITAVVAAAAGGGGVVGPLLAGHLTGGGILLNGRLVN